MVKNLSLYTFGVGAGFVNWKTVGRPGCEAGDEQNFLLCVLSAGGKAISSDEWHRPRSDFPRFLTLAVSVPPTDTCCSRQNLNGDPRTAGQASVVGQKDAASMFDGGSQVQSIGEFDSHRRGHAHRRSSFVDGGCQR